MNSQAEMGLAEIDQKIANSDRNIRKVGIAYYEARNEWLSDC